MQTNMLEIFEMTSTEHMQPLHPADLLNFKSGTQIPSVIICSGQSKQFSQGSLR